MAVKPNVIVITSDQQRYQSLGCLGANWMKTPALDAMAREGVAFTQAYCSNPTCSPSRASIFTGRYPSRHGVWNCGINLPPQEVLISHRLADEGYRTHYVGKTHFQVWGGSYDESVESMEGWKRRFPDFTGPYYGFQSVEMSLGHSLYGFKGHYGCWVREQVGSPERFSACHGPTKRYGENFEGNAFDTDLPMRLHQSVWAADRAIEFMRGHDRKQPFMLAIGFHDPHHPHALPLEYTNRVDPAAVPLPDYVPGELDDKPEHFRLAQEGRLEGSKWRGQYPVAGQGAGSDYRLVPEDAARLGRAYYYSTVQLMDEQIGRVLGELRRLGIEEDTLVVFTSDHGEMLGDHGIWLKGPFHYDQLVHVPLVMRYPRGLAGRGCVEGLASLVDIVPTILEAAGLAPHAGIDGTSLLPLARGEVAHVHDAVLVEHTDDPATLRLKTIITRTHKLTKYQGQPFGELFDLVADPGEKVNRWEDPAYAQVKAQLLSSLIDLLEPGENRLPRRYYC